MVHRDLLLLLMVSACGFRAGTTADRVDGGTMSDGEAMSDAPACLGRGLVRVCVSSVPAPLTLDTQTIDTSVDGSCTKIQSQVGGAELCVLAAHSISVIGVVTAIGSRPLVLAAATSLTLTGVGVIDVSSTAGSTGAGADHGALCDLVTFRANDGEGDSGGGGGGAGGGFGTPGGNGGRGDDNDNQPPFAHKGIPGLAGGQQPPPTVLRGGCRGGTGGGGANDTQALGPSGGSSGGAVYLIAGDSLALSGNVFASGEGGRRRQGAPGFMDGGAGGGSGGMIGLDAPSLTLDGLIVANGGAGSGGGDINGGAPGMPGSTLAWNTPAIGGVGDPCCGGDGGSGTAGATVTPTAGQLEISGGGGGGGGAGVVWIDGTITSVTPMISPAPTAH